MSTDGESGQTNTPLYIQGVQPPIGLDLSGKDKTENWKLYKHRWNNYSVVAQLERQTEKNRVPLFLYSIGPDAIKTFNSFDLSEERRGKLDVIIEEFDKYAIGEINETYERYVFNNRAQKEDESIDEYVAELRTLAKTCNFCVCLNDTPIRDRIVLGIRDNNTRK